MDDWIEAGGKRHPPDFGIVEIYPLTGLRNHPSTSAPRPFSLVRITDSRSKERTLPRAEIKSNVWLPSFRPQSHATHIPIANPAKAKPVQVKTGKSHGWGSPRLCTPLIYDSSAHGSQCGRHVVHSSGVSKEIVRATAAAAPAKTSRGRRDFPAAHKTAPQLTPMSIIEMPMVLRISTRNRSLHGAQPQEIRYSCARNSSPKLKISAPRRIVVRAI